MRCFVCGRSLRSSRSQRLAVGPACAKKVFRDARLLDEVFFLLAEKYRAAQEREKELTPFMHEMAELLGARLEGLEYRIKSNDSFVRKVHADIEIEQKKPEQAAEKVRDLVRYTLVFERNNYTRNTEQALALFEAKGWHPVRIKNFWNNPKTPYRGINVIIETDEGFSFEVQFHTKESLNAKMKMHPLYEQCRRMELCQKDRKFLEAQMDEIARSVSQPLNVENIAEVKEE